MNATEVRDYVATDDELQAIDPAMAEIDRGEVAAEDKIEAAFRKLRRE